MVSYLTRLLLSKDFVIVVHSQCCYAFLWQRYLQFSLMPIGRLKAYGYETMADDTTIFLRDFSRLTEIELILELCEKAVSSKINFSKSQILWGVAFRNRIYKPRHLQVHFRNSVHDIRNLDKIYDNLTKNYYKIHI